MQKIIFSKYHGLGNDFIVIDARSEQNIEALPIIDKKPISKLCDRHFGIGADGVLLVLPPKKKGDIAMRIFNADGSEAEMCGNGIRCLIKFIIDTDKDSEKYDFVVETLAGYIKASFEQNNLIRVNMGDPIFNPLDIPCNLDTNELGIPSGIIKYKDKSYQVYAAGMGNPHLILYINNSQIDLATLGSFLEIHNKFPQNTNVHFVEIVDKNNMNVYVWERGSGPTLACGTGACAVVATSVKLNLSSSKTTVTLPGGKLLIDWPNINGPIYKSGPAELVYKGNIIV